MDDKGIHASATREPGHETGREPDHVPGGGAGPADRRGWLSLTALAAFLGSLALGVLQPLYTDDLGWRLQERAWFDGVDKLYGDMCGPGALAAPAFFMWPVRAFSGIMGRAFADPLWIRLAGLLHALGFVLLLGILAARLIPRGRARDTGLATVFALLGLGVMPWLMLWSRPEQPLLLVLAGALLLALGRRSDRAAPAGWRAWAAPLAISALAAIGLAYHLKGVIIAPVMIACIALAGPLDLSRAGRASRKARGVCVVACIALTALGARYWFARLSCPADPILADQFSGQSLVAKLTMANSLGPAGWIVLRNIVNLPEYIVIATPRAVMMSEWLPSGLVPPGIAKLWGIIATVCWSGALLLAMRLAAGRSVAAWRARRIDRPALLGLLLLAMIVGWGTLQSARNDYEAIFVLPVLALAILLLAGSDRGLDPDPATAGNRGWASLFRLAPLLVLVSLASQAAAAAFYAPALVESARTPGVRPAQPVSLGVFGYAAIRRDAHAAARLCGMAHGAALRRPVLDDTTYLAFVDSYRPDHYQGVFGNWRGTLDDPVAWLERRRSGGVIMACDRFPANLRDKAKAVGGVCCLGPFGA